MQIRHFRHKFDAVPPNTPNEPDKAAPLAEEASIESLTFDRLFLQYGPLVTVDELWRLLNFRSRDAFNRSVLKGSLPLRVIRPAGRREAFVATKEVAAYLASLAAVANEEDARLREPNRVV